MMAGERTPPERRPGRTVALAIGLFAIAVSRLIGAGGRGRAGARAGAAGPDGRGRGPDGAEPGGRDKAPGEHAPGARPLGSYVIGLVLAAALTAASFWSAGSDIIYQPAIPILLIVLAIAQQGVHLVFFLHIDTSPDRTNSVLALAFGVMVVALVMGGSLWIVTNLNANMMPMDKLMQMQR